MFDDNTPLIPVGTLARKLDRSIESINLAAQKLGIKFTKNTTGYREASLRQGQKIDKHFADRNDG